MLPSSPRSAVDCICEGDTISMLRYYKAQADEQRREIAQAGEAGDGSILARIGLASVLLNRTSLLLRAERWRTALKEVDSVREVLEEIERHDRDLGVYMIKPMLAELRLRFALTSGLALSHLKGRGKGRNAAIDMLHKGLRYAREAEAAGTICSVELIFRIVEEIKHFGASADNSSAASRATTSTLSVTAHTARTPTTGHTHAPAPAPAPAPAQDPAQDPAASTASGHNGASQLAHPPNDSVSSQTHTENRLDLSDAVNTATSDAPRHEACDGFQAENNTGGTISSVPPASSDPSHPVKAPTLLDNDNKDGEEDEKVKKKRKNKKKKKRKARNTSVDSLVSVPALEAVPIKNHSASIEARGLVPSEPKPLTQQQQQLLSVGYMYVNTGRLKDANQVFDALLKDCPSCLGALLGRGSAWALSASAASSAANLAPNVSAEVDEGTAKKMAREAYMRALNDFSSAIKHHPKVADCYKRRGQVLAALGGELNNADAISDITRAIEIQKEESGSDLAKLDADAFQQRGQIHQRQKNYLRALKDLRLAVQIRIASSGGSGSKNAEGQGRKGGDLLATLWNAVGLSLNALGENEAASEAYRHAIKSAGAGGMKEAWCNLGQARRDAGDEEGSEVAFAEALRLDPQLLSALHMRGLLRHGTGRPYAALEDFSRGLVYDPTHDGCRLMAGLVLQSMGGFTEALMHYAKLLQNFPDSGGGKGNSSEPSTSAGLTASATSVHVPSNRTWCYYLAHLSLYFRCILDRSVWVHSLDDEIDPKFKENATKRTPPDETKGHTRVSFTTKKAGDRLTSGNELTDITVEKAQKGTSILVPDWLVKSQAYQTWKVKSASPILPSTISMLNEDVVYRKSILLDDDEMERWYEKPQDTVVSQGVINEKEGNKEEEQMRLASLRQLLPVCDGFGRLVQLQCKGFLANQRQHRQFGMAVVSMAQAARDWWWGSSSGKAADIRGCRVRNYRELMDIAVRWRQVSEPNDPVWWIDKLTPESFGEGFGLQTPLVTGQTHVPRYYPYFSHALSITRELVLEQMILDDNQRDLVRTSTTCKDLYAAVGHKDFWVCTTCARLSEDEEMKSSDGVNVNEHSTILESNRFKHKMSKFVGIYESTEKPSKRTQRKSTPMEGEDLGASLPMEGTRLTLVSHAPEGFEFTIRMPGLPSRYRQYNRECETAFEKVKELATKKMKAEANAGSNSPVTQELVQGVVRGCVTVFFYWVTWAPLTRGSAATGYAVLTALMLAAGVELIAPPPPGLQADWEAILRSRASNFVARIEAEWLGKEDAVRSFKIGSKNEDPLEDLPVVTSTLTTLRHMIECMNVTEY